MTHDEFEASAKKFCDEFNAVAAMKQALEALYELKESAQYDSVYSKAIDALRAAIAEASMQQLTDVQQEMEHSEDVLEMVEPVAWEAIEKIAQERYKVGPSDISMFYRFAVLAGNGTQHLYIGREIECQNMARKFAGAFLDGAFLYEKMATLPRREWVGLTDEEIDRVWRSVDYKISYDNFRLAIARAIEAALKEKNT